MGAAMIDTDDGFVPLLQRRAAATPGGLYALYEGVALTYAELDRRSSALAARLRSSGLAKGDRVAVMIRNSPAALALVFAIGKAGLVSIPVNVQAKGDGLAYILTHSDPALVIADHDLVETVRASRAPLAGVRMWTAGRPGADLEQAAEGVAPFSEPLPGPDDDLCILYTSGTTGRPKGVLVSHRMLRLSGEAVALVASIEDGAVMIMWEPLYHIGGLQMVIVPLIRRAHLAMVERFSASRYWQQTKDYGATHIHFLGGILQILLKQPPSPLDRTHGARIAWGGGCPPDIWRPFEERFGVEIHECYGMTEASSITTWNERLVVGSVGRPVPWLGVELLDAAGQPVPQGARGEIVVSAKLPGAITRGYFRNPEATAKALRAGRLYTGDIGSFDADGYMRFHGRMTDNVRVKGENVSSFEVEHVAAQHPAVEDCAMIGVATDVGEQDIKLFVKAKAGTTLEPAALAAWLGERLASYQVPRYIKVVADFERTPSQRIMKHALSKALDDAWDRFAGKGR